jgi:hypothetical protein
MTEKRKFRIVRYIHGTTQNRYRVDEYMKAGKYVPGLWVSHYDAPTKGRAERYIQTVRKLLPEEVVKEYEV